MINYTSDHLRTMIAVEEANKYADMSSIPEVKVEGYDPNISASGNALNFKLNQEVEVEWGKKEVLLMRLIYPQIWFYSLLAIYFFT